LWNEKIERQIIRIKKTGEKGGNLKILKSSVWSLYFSISFFDPFGFWNFNFDSKLYFSFILVSSLRDEREIHQILMVGSESLG
jgi:hypothetical protein